MFDSNSNTHIACHLLWWMKLWSRVYSKYDVIIYTIALDDNWLWFCATSAKLWRESEANATECRQINWHWRNPIFWDLLKTNKRQAKRRFGVVWKLKPDTDKYLQWIPLKDEKLAGNYSCRLALHFSYFDFEIVACVRMKSGHDVQRIETGRTASVRRYKVHAQKFYGAGVGRWELLLKTNQPKRSKTTSKINEFRTRWARQMCCYWVCVKWGQRMRWKGGKTGRECARKPRNKFQ